MLPVCSSLWGIFYPGRFRLWRHQISRHLPPAIQNNRCHLYHCNAHVLAKVGEDNRTKPHFRTCTEECGCAPHSASSRLRTSRSGQKGPCVGIAIFPENGWTPNKTAIMAHFSSSYHTLAIPPQAAGPASQLQGQFSGAARSRRVQAGFGGAGKNVTRSARSSYGRKADDEPGRCGNC